MRVPLAITNSNPLNIRFSPMNDWRGQVASRKGFCQFDSMFNGCRAALVLLCNYIRKGYDTVPEIIARWAPASENDTKAYIRTVLSRLAFRWYDSFDGAAVSCARSKKLNRYDLLADLAYEMAWIEIGANYLSKNDVVADSLFECFHSIATSEKLPKLPE